jgi:hypothetical protein
MSPSRSCRRPALRRALARGVAGVGMATAAMALLASSAGATETTPVPLGDQFKNTSVDATGFSDADCGGLDPEEGPVWHFIANQLGDDAGTGTVTAHFGDEADVTLATVAQASQKVLTNTQHFYVQSTHPVLIDASASFETPQPGAKLVLSHICTGTTTPGDGGQDPDPTCEDDPTLEGCDDQNDPTCEDDDPTLEGCDEQNDPTCEDDPTLEGCDDQNDPTCEDDPTLEGCDDQNDGGNPGGSTPTIVVELTPVVEDEAPLVFDEAIEADTPAPAAEAPEVESLIVVPEADVVEETPAAPVVTAQAAGDPVVAGRTTLPRTGLPALAPAGLGVLMLAMGIALNAAAVRRRSAVR